jgi:outer membrane protein assembly factor BamB
LLSQFDDPGYGSPLVAGGRVYQHARQGDDEVVWCLDLKIGAVRWQQSYATPFKIGGGGEYHGKGPKSSPTLADGRLFTMSVTGMLTAWDAASGKRLWQFDASDRFKKTHPRWGASASPIVDGDRVIAHFGTDGRGALIALDAATGKEVWRQGEDGPSYASALVVEISGVRQVIDWNERALVGVDARISRRPRAAGRREPRYPLYRAAFGKRRLEGSRTMASEEGGAQHEHRSDERQVSLWILSL